MLPAPAKSPGSHPDMRQHNKQTASTCQREGSRAGPPALADGNSKGLSPKSCFPPPRTHQLRNDKLQLSGCRSPVCHQPPLALCTSSMKVVLRPGNLDATTTSKHPTWKHWVCPERLSQSHAVPSSTSTYLVHASVAEENQPPEPPDTELPCLPRRTVGSTRH